MVPILKSIIICILIFGQALTEEPCEPYGVRLALGNHYADSSSSQRLTIRFNTLELCSRSFIEIYPSTSEDLRVLCSSTLLTFDTYASYIHECSISHLLSGEDF